VACSSHSTAPPEPFIRESDGLTIGCSTIRRTGKLGRSSCPRTATPSVSRPALAVWDDRQFEMHCVDVSVPDDGREASNTAVAQLLPNSSQMTGNPEVDRRDADFTGVIYGGSSEPKGLRLHRRMPRTTVALYLYEETHKLLEGQFRIELFFGLMCVQIF
jgi:hypothetical protein